MTKTAPQPKRPNSVVITRQNAHEHKNLFMKATKRFKREDMITEPQHAKTIREQAILLSSGSTLQGKAAKGIYLGTSEPVYNPASLDLTEIQARREALEKRGEEIKAQVKHAAAQIKAQRAFINEGKAKKAKAEIAEKFYKQNLKKKDDE